MEQLELESGVELGWGQGVGVERGVGVGGGWVRELGSGSWGRGVVVGLKLP